MAHLVRLHRIDESMEHTVQPKLVYISNPTEYGTIYALGELEALSRVCRENGLYLFLDGARLGYGLRCRENDVTLADLARLCDAFYIGGTKVGALFGEALVLTNAALNEDFRYLIKQRGGMLAKGRLLGIQFEELFRDELYFDLARHANRMARRLQDGLTGLGIPLLCQSPTNLVFPILTPAQLERFSQHAIFEIWGEEPDGRKIIRLVTSWATTEEAVDGLLEELAKAL